MLYEGSVASRNNGPTITWLMSPSGGGVDVFWENSGGGTSALGLEVVSAEVGVVVRESKLPDFLSSKTRLIKVEI